MLGIGAFPVNWPLGTGPDFKGVYDRQTKQVHLFERTSGGAYRAPVSIGDLERPGRARATGSPTTTRSVLEELEMLEQAGANVRPRGGARRAN